MKLKTLKYITFTITFALTFLCHFMYEWFPNLLTSIFFPVNESIWEHMKMLYTAILLGGLIEYIIIKKNNIKANNILLTIFIKAISSIPVFLMLYLPLYNIFKENMILNIGVMIITLVIVEILSYYILSKDKITFENAISLLLIIISYIIFSVLTYYPPKTELFYDKQDNKYGISIYEI